jgi:hypothetical protein
VLSRVYAYRVSQEVEGFEGWDWAPLHDYERRVLRADPAGIEWDDLAAQLELPAGAVSRYLELHETIAAGWVGFVALGWGAESLPIEALAVSEAHGASGPPCVGIRGAVVGSAVGALFVASAEGAPPQLGGQPWPDDESCVVVRTPPGGFGVQ